MHLDKYALSAEGDLTTFEFIIEGRRGAIRKLIIFQETTEPNLYNLAFGDRNETTGELNDLAVSDNGDSEKVLATVVGALYSFFDKYPAAFVYATGSTSARTRLYRMGIHRFLPEVMTDFHLYGQIGDFFHEFEPNIAYDGFLVQRNLLNL
ncbi:hypothetical protein Q5H93_13315 [Hymenobacter sp. ASUV-10]|uniref:Uncharacterized protein n=1 Tax=Hymenobacter aranciens TaxID=3063996 RepID=A0ABT9BBU6_9BACT|nr:hypothetical protein [Hymenobacter sp. ASUV-10]MDO7875718.1 hypothetical protein [Hymenobacter sp. ASUV-10]